jgi:hypothetical protein
MINLDTSTCTEVTDDEINDSWSILAVDLSNHFITNYISNVMSNCISYPGDFYSCKGDPSQYTSYRGTCDSPAEGSDDSDSSQDTDQEGDNLQFESSSKEQMSQTQKLTIFIGSWFVIPILL